MAQFYYELKGWSVPAVVEKALRFYYFLSLIQLHILLSFLRSIDLRKL